MNSWTHEMAEVGNIYNTICSIFKIVRSMHTWKLDTWIYTLVEGDCTSFTGSWIVVIVKIPFLISAPTFHLQIYMWCSCIHIVQIRYDDSCCNSTTKIRHMYALMLPYAYDWWWDIAIRVVNIYNGAYEHLIRARVYNSDLTMDIAIVFRQ